MTGIRGDAQCVVPGVSCGNLGCAKFVDPMADDGKTAAPGVAIEVGCVQGTCRTHVVTVAAFPCGSTSCAGGELCIHPPTSVGGPQPLCVPVPDGGACPPGTEYAQYCGGTGNGGCVEIYVPPPPYCAAIPAACGATVDCKCIPQTLCGGGADFCQNVVGADVTCVNLAP